MGIQPPGIGGLEIYDAQGRLQASMRYTGNTTLWDASSFAEGLYLIVARLKDGKPGAKRSSSKIRNKNMSHPEFQNDPTCWYWKG